MNNQKGWCISKIGWCVGSNPPSVLCGIRLIGLPAPSGRCFIGVCLPFPLAGRPFHRFHVGALDLTKVSSPSPGGRFVSAPLPTLSRCSLRNCNSTCGRSFLRPRILGPTATHQLASLLKNAHSQTNKHAYSTRILCASLKLFSNLIVDLCEKRQISTPLWRVFIHFC